MRSVRYILDVSDLKIAQIIGLAGKTVTADQVQLMLLNEEDPRYVRCDDFLMSHFLDGLIYFKRGRDTTKPPLPFEIPISNNVYLKKLRVAFTLKESDMIEILTLADFRLSVAELSALMRKKDHPNYRECGDQIVRYFLKGLTIKVRGSHV